ncbi:MAG TPA: ester cyclase [Cyclobacteriaceae bacterium]|jgi:predicted ester cyclase/heme-degrading monooxygenase HmoA
MKTAFTQAITTIALSAAQVAFGQMASDHTSKNLTDMETILKTNKEVVTDLYEVVLNQRKFELLDEVISADYVNVQGEEGPAAFGKVIRSIVHAFPDAKWKLETIVAEGNSVVVKHTLSGTHENNFQNIPATGKSFSNEGWALYELSGGKIIRSQLLTDRLSFLQQIGILPEDPLVHARRLDTYVYFVDRFLVPKEAIEVFTDRMNHNRAFIKTLPGFVRDEVIASELENGDINLITIAVWESMGHLEQARKRVQEEYKKTNFDPEKFTKSLNITMERQLYHIYR